MCVCTALSHVSKGKLGRTGSLLSSVCSQHIAGPSPFPSLIYPMTLVTGAGGDGKKGEFVAEREAARAKLVPTLLELGTHGLLQLIMG